MDLMAEHVFESPLVEEFYNSCHLKANGRFCGVGAKGKGVGRVPMSDAARASNATLRGKAAKTRKKMAAKQAQSKGAMEKMAKSSSKVVKAPSKYKDYGSGKTDPSALKMTQKYGTRQAPRKNAPGVRTPIPGKAKGGAAPQKNAPGVRTPIPGKAKGVAAAPQYGSGKTEPGALSLTNRFGTASRGKKVVAPPKYGKDNAGSGKTDPKALSLTQRYGTRRK